MLFSPKNRRLIIAIMIFLITAIPIFCHANSESDNVVPKKPADSGKIILKCLDEEWLSRLNEKVATAHYFIAHGYRSWIAKCKKKFPCHKEDYLNSGWKVKSISEVKIYKIVGKDGLSADCQCYEYLMVK